MISEGGGRMMLRMPRLRTATSHSSISAALIPIGQPKSPADCRNFLSMACLDRFAQAAHILIERFTLHHRDLARSRQVDRDLVDNRCRTPSHDQYAIRQEGRFANAMGDEND